MYACIHGAADVYSLALAFSPEVEQTDSETCVFSIAPLRKLLGSPHQVASEICRIGFEQKIQANLAIAANPDTAILLARYCIGVTLVTPGEERLKIGPLPLSSVCDDPAMLQTLQRWGLKTCEDLSALPEKGVAERLGAAGVRVWTLARGCVHRPLRLQQEIAPYREHVELEHPVSLLEPLLFLFARTLNEFSIRLRSQSQAVRTLKLQLKLEDRADYNFELEFPVPLQESATMLKLLQLHLERHSPAAPICGFTLALEPVAPRRIQGGFFVPPTPPPDKLQVTLSRIAAMVGEGNVGTPRLLNTHRPDAFDFVPLNITPPVAPATGPDTLRLTMRLFRPALEAHVILANEAPKHILSSKIKGEVLKWAGPWKTSGDWWTSTAWTREEWDVALDDGALYRIYQQPDAHAWYVGAVYD